VNARNERPSKRRSNKKRKEKRRSDRNRLRRTRSELSNNRRKMCSKIEFSISSTEVRPDLNPQLETLKQSKIKSSVNRNSSLRSSK